MRRTPPRRKKANLARSARGAAGTEDAMRKQGVGSLLMAGLLGLPSAASAEAASAAGATDAAASVDIPYQRFLLPNGLTLLVHEDRKAPIVAVNIWYHVGSKNERPGKTGFAHLFEHLMFNGSENLDDDYFQALERLGATDLNGTTNEDRTNYFQNVPVGALDTVLWLESDRMGHMLGAVKQAKLDEQRGVVQNEKRQYENEPYSVSDELIARSTFPAGHPYSWTVIGSMEDLNAASLEDVHQWFRTYYGAANAVLSIAGDVDAQTVRSKVEQYFRDVPSGPPVARHEVWIAKRTGTQKQTAQDRVPQARVYRIWNVPPWSLEESDLLELAARVLGTGKTSRLYKRLVYDDQTATDVSVQIDSREIAGQFRIEATAKPGGELAVVEKAIDEEMARFLSDGPTERELERVKTSYVAEFVRGIERIGGFGGKSDILAKGLVFGGDPDHYRVALGRMRQATTEQVRKVARDWLLDGVYVLEVRPFHEQPTAESGVDRSRMPVAGKSADPKFPEFRRATLANGLKVVLVERHAAPVVRLGLLVDAGYASDQLALPGTAKLAMEMLDEGTKQRNALQISDQLALAGAELETGSNLDMSTVTLSALKGRLAPSLDLFADVVLNPSFPEAELERLRKEQLAAIQREKVGPVPMALRVFPRILYGQDHAYGNPFTGSGTEVSVSRIKREDLVRFHQGWFKPNNATLVIVGDTTWAEIQPKLEELFRDWRKGEVPRKNVKQVEPQPASSVYIVDRPGSIQSIIIAGHVAPPRANPDEIAIETMNNVLGGLFTSRLNMNLREDKHWAYGAGSFLPPARGQRPFLAYAPVQTDKTKEAIAEMLEELRGIRGGRPVTAEELAKVQSAQTLALPGSWETGDAVAASISELVSYGLPDDHYDTYAAKVRALKVDNVASVAQKVIHPDRLVWVVVGDRAKI